jgi:hypothetical protein
MMNAPLRSEYLTAEEALGEPALSLRGRDGHAAAGPAHGEAADWGHVRRPVALSDRALLDRTFKWLATLPPSVRPMATGAQYPRIVNRIGDLWGHCEYTRLYLQSLLIDRRKGRHGFPEEVKRELQALQQYYFEHLSGLPAILWNAVPVRTPRIPHEVFPLRAEPAEIDIRPL